MEKKLLFAFVVALCTTTANALPTLPIINQRNVDRQHTTQQVSATKLQSLRLSTEGHQLQALSLTDNVLTSITTPPTTDEYVNCSRDAFVYLTNYGYTDARQLSGTIGKYVLDTDGTLYIFNPVAALNTNTWVKAEKDSDGLYVVRGSQQIYEEEAGGETYQYNFAKLKFSQDDEWFFVTDNQDIKYELKDGILKLVEEDYCIAGIVDAATNNWMGFGNVTDVFNKIDEQPVTPPAGLVFEDYLFVDHDSPFLVKAATDGNDFYVRQMLFIDPDLCFKGTITDGKITFPDKQYMGADELNGAHLYLCGADTVQVYDEEWDYYYRKYILSGKDIVFDIDKDTKALTTNDLFVVNVGKDNMQFITFHQDARISPWTEVPATPIDPMIDIFSEYDPEREFGYMTFYIYCWDADGKYLNPDKMQYRIYIDDEVYTFDPDDFESLEEEITDVPFYLSVPYLLQTYGGENHTLYYYFTGFDKIGVQSIYNGGGERHESNITYYEVNSGNQDISADFGKTIQSTVYTDLMGHNITNPGSGFYIETTTYTDGSQKISKIIKR